MSRADGVLGTHGIKTCESLQRPGAHCLTPLVGGQQCGAPPAAQLKKYSSSPPAETVTRWLLGTLWATRTTISRLTPSG